VCAWNSPGSLIRNLPGRPNRLTSMQESTHPSLATKPALRSPGLLVAPPPTWPPCGNSIHIGPTGWTRDAGDSPSALASAQFPWWLPLEFPWSPHLHRRKFSALLTHPLNPLFACFFSHPSIGEPGARARELKRTRHSNPGTPLNSNLSSSSSHWFESRVYPLGIWPPLLEWAVRIPIPTLKPWPWTFALSTV
jgi:hypothetical protein